MTKEEQEIVDQGRRAFENRYAKGSNPHRGKPGNACRLWNIGWTTAKKESRRDQQEHV